MADLEHLICLTEELIRYRSTKSNPEALFACADMLASYFADTGLEIQRFTHEGIPSLLIAHPGIKKPKVLLNGHFDVVDAEDDQFIPRREGERLIGRGALDMKSGLAVMMSLMKQAKERNWDVGLMLVGDEEVGGFHGSGYLTSLGFGGDVVIIPDGGLAVHRIIEKEKGVLRLTLQAKGEPAHGSVPWKGKNAIQLLAQALTDVQKAFVPLENHPEDHWVTTCNIGLIEGGIAANQVAPTAKAVCDIRFTEHDTVEEIIARVKQYMPEGVEVEHTLTVPPMFTPASHPMVKVFAEVVQQFGREAEFSLAHGSSDGRFFSQQGSPVIISQPDGADHHGRTEWVHMASIGVYSDVLEAFLERVAKRD